MAVQSCMAWIQIKKNCDRAFDLWQQLESASELESDLQDSADWGRKWLVRFNVGKAQLISFDWCDNTGAIYVKADGSVLEEKSYLKMLWLTLSSKLYWGSYITSIAKTAYMKNEAMICYMKFLSPVVALYPYGLAWNTVVMSGLMLLAATWNC